MTLARRPLLAAVAVAAFGASLAAGAIAQPAKLKVAAIYTVPVEQQWVSRIDKALKAAAARGVGVGAPVADPDLVGFGRRAMDIASADLVADLVYQIGALQGLAHAAGTRVRYVKPHGALYNTIAHDERQARDVITAIRAVDGKLALVGLAGSRGLALAREAGLRTIAEAFADRAYTPQGTLVSRREQGAVLHDADQVARRMLQLVTEGTLEAIDGSLARVQAQSICVHGDSPDAVAMARATRRTLEQAGVELRAFC